MPNKFIFLDIDDVLVTTRQHHSKRLHHKYMTCPFDEKCVKVLNEIIKETNPIIILSSDWRTQFKLEVLNEIFYDNKIKSVITDFTPILMGIKFNNRSELQVCRATEILHYVKEHQIIDWVAIDDWDLKPWIPDNFVRCTSSYEGIKQCDVKNKILNILK